MLQGSENRLPYSLVLTCVSSLFLGACFEPEDPNSSGMGTQGPSTTTSTPDDTTGTTAAPSDTTSSMETSTGEPPADSSSDSSTTAAPAECGNGMLEADEECDDGNNMAGDGCSAMCTVAMGWDCDGASPTVCVTVCGDGVVAAPVEQCDDGNEIATDACTDTCQEATCGDGIVWEGGEMCDDGGMMPGDGCNPLCDFEPGYFCVGSPSVCDPGIYVADGAAGIVGNLWIFSIDGMNMIDLGPLNVPLTGMAFHPNGTLYAVTASSGAGMGIGQLGTIDLATIQFNPIGNLVAAGGTAHNRMPDITFMHSQLLGWTESGDDLALINAASGFVTPISTTQGSAGTALGYDSASDEIFVAPNGPGGTLYRVTIGGMVIPGPTLGGTNSSVKGMAFYNGLFYGMDTNYSGGPVGNLVTYDPMTGAMNVLAPLPSPNIDALAIYDPNNTP